MTEGMTQKELWKYVAENEKTCVRCGKTKRMSSFFNKEDNIIYNHCKPCYNKVYEHELLKAVISSLSERDDLEDIL